MGERVRITDVSPRDGLQNEAGIIPTAEKVELVRLLCASGVDEVEVTSFVSPKWVPQLGDAGEVLREVLDHLIQGWPKPWPALNVLIPNLRGLQNLESTVAAIRRRLIESHGAKQRTGDDMDSFEHWIHGSDLVDKISLFTAASETFSKRNTNAGIHETIDRFAEVQRARGPDLLVRGYVSCAIACPFEGPIHPRKVASVVEQLVALGVNEIDLGDTIGAAEVESTTHLLSVMRDVLSDRWFAEQSLTLHLHDTFGRAAECVKAALDLGIRSFDGSVAGLGGCPYASTPGKRAPGNIATHTLVKTIHEAGFTTGVDLAKLDEAAAFATKIVTASRARAASASAGEHP